MDSENYEEGQSMQRPPLFETNCFIYWKNRFETYVKSKDIVLWHIIVYGNYIPTIKNKDRKDEIISYEKFEESHKKMISKNDEAKMVLYNALPKKEYERIFMCNTAKDVWNLLIITRQDLKALDESFLIRNHVRKFLRALPTKWRPKVAAIESLALKARKVSSDEEVSCSKSDDEEYAIAVRDLKKFFRRRGKFVHQPHDDKKNFRKIKEDKKEKEDRRCFKCGDPNYFISDCPKHSYNDQKAFVVGVGAIVKMTPRRKKFVSWHLTTMRCAWCGGPFNGGNYRRCTNVSFGYEFVRNPDPISYDETPDFSYPPPQLQTYSCELCRNDSHYGYDCPPRVPLVYEQESCYNQNFG
nr:hypothetical protein [Tanacetum cinerariifolium]